MEYDEDLSVNPFFLYLKDKCTSLFERATECKWIICVPRVGSLGSLQFTQPDLENHILQIEDGDQTSINTVSGKDLQVKGGVITTGDTFKQKRTVPILFEETFFNKNDESYRVLCIGCLLEGNTELGDEVDGDVESILDSMPATLTVLLHGPGDSADLLWGNSGNLKMKQQLDSVLETYRHNLKDAACSTLPSLISASESIYNKAMVIVLRDSYLKKKSKENEGFSDAVKLAVETYMLHFVYLRLVRCLSTCLGSKNSHFNSITRNLPHLQLKQLEVRLEACQSVPRARKELTNLGRYTTPLGKLNCLRRVVNALLQPSNAARCGKMSPLTTDDLLPILVFLVIKADMPSWWSQLSFMSNFRFSKPNAGDENGYYLATLEAALEHVCSGKVLQEMDAAPEDPDVVDLVQLSASPDTRISPWQADATINATRQLFTYVRDNNCAAVQEILSRGQSQPRSPLTPPSPKCHPLCTCDRCLRKMDVRGHVKINLHSRDARGFTVLHLAAIQDYVQMSHILVKHGAPLDARDYSGRTPLHGACSRGHQSIVLILIHAGADLNVQENEKSSPLHLAAYGGHEDCIKALIFFDQGQGKLNLNLRDDFGNTALHHAAKWGYASIVEQLLDSGARSALFNRKNQPPVFYAQNLTIIQILARTEAREIEHAKAALIGKANVKSTSNQTKTKPVRQQSLPVSPTQSEAASSPEYTTRNKKLPRQRTLPVTATLPQSVPQSPDGVSSTIPTTKVTLSRPLVKKREKRISKRRISDATERRLDKMLIAVADGDEQMVSHHFGWQSDTDEDEKVAEAGEMELCHPLCQCERCQPLQRLSVSSHNGLHVDATNAQGYSALHVATLHSHYSLMQLLLRRGAAVNCRTLNYLCTPLHLACKSSTDKPLELLLSAGADPDVADVHGHTPLHYSCMVPSLGKLTLLLQHGAQPDCASVKGSTPLHEATRRNLTHLARPLLAAGANIYSTNRDGKRPADYAQTEEMFAVLKAGVQRRQSADDTPQSSFDSSTPASTSSQSSASPRIRRKGSYQNSNPSTPNTSCRSAGSSLSFDSIPASSAPSPSTGSTNFEVSDTIPGSLHSFPDGANPTILTETPTKSPDQHTSIPAENSPSPLNSGHDMVDAT